MTAKYRIKDTFKITGRGLVLAGYIEEGIVLTGSYIEFSAFDIKRKRKIIGVEGVRQANPDKANTGLLIECVDKNEIDELRSWRPKDDIGVITRD
jgi:translation elongation factor EF-Tu-like GTPase